MINKVNQRNTRTETETREQLESKLVYLLTHEEAHCDDLLWLLFREVCDHSFSRKDSFVWEQHIDARSALEMHLTQYDLWNELDDEERAQEHAREITRLVLSIMAPQI